MGILSRAIEKRNVENPTYPLTSAKLLSLFGGAKSKANVTVNSKTLLTLSGVFAANRVLSETVACVPLIFYKRDGNGKARAKSDPLYRLLHSEPNPEQSSYKFRETMEFYACYRGNAFAWIERNKLGMPKAIWQLTSDPDCVQLERINGNLFYRYYSLDKTGYELIPAKDMIHIYGLSNNGLVGLSLVEMVLKELGGIALASQDYAAKWFANSASNGAVLEHPQNISEEAVKRLKNQIIEEYSGANNSHKVKVLEEGMKLHELGGDPSASQLLEQRKFSVSEAARIWRVPPHMIGDLEHATFTNIEHQSIEFLKYTMLPWFVNWEQELNRKLIPEKQKNDYFFEFLIDGLSRGDAQTRAEYYSKAFQNGWMNRDEIRSKENMNPIPDGKGSAFYVPLNLIEAGSNNPKTETKSNDNHYENQNNTRNGLISQSIEQRAKAGAVRKKLRNAYIPVFEDVFDRVFKLEYAELRKAIKKHMNKRDSKTFFEWLETFYFDTFPEKSHDKLKRVFNSLAKAIAEEAGKEVDSELSQAEFDTLVQDYTDNYIKKHCADSRLTLTKIINDSLVDDTDTVKLLNTKIDKWEESRYQHEAQAEAVSVEGALSRAVFVNAGMNLIWVTSGENCDLCDSLSGKVVGRDESFLAAGDTIETGETTFSRKSNVLHAPLHGGCDCTIIAG